MDGVLLPLRTRRHVVVLRIGQIMKSIIFLDTVQGRVVLYKFTYVSEYILWPS
jgi:hypothetical protein